MNKPRQKKNLVPRKGESLSSVWGSPCQPENIHIENCVSVNGIFIYSKQNIASTSDRFRIQPWSLIAEHTQILSTHHEHIQSWTCVSNCHLTFKYNNDIKFGRGVSNGKKTMTEFAEIIWLQFMLTIRTELNMYSDVFC